MIIRSTLPSSYMKYWISLVLALLQASSADAFLTSPRLSSLGRSQTKSNILRKRDDIPAIGFFDPNAQDGGHFLTEIPVTYPMGLGEPLNIVISANSDYDVLKDREDHGGFRNYFLSLDFSGECLGQSLGTDQKANLGDGNGPLNETAVLRYNYKDPYVGSCKETIQGGNHIRYWTQNGKDANSGAIFIAASVELPIDKGHDIVQNGYNLGRDWIIGNITGSVIPSPNPLSIAPGPGPAISSASVASIYSLASDSVVSLSSVALTASAVVSTTNVSDSFTPTSTSALVMPSPIPTITLNKSYGSGVIEAVPGGQFTGMTTFGGYWYQTTVTYYTGFMGNSSEGVNHPVTVEQDGRPAMDGLLAVLDVKITQRPDGESSFAHSLRAPHIEFLLPFIFISVTLTSSLYP